MKAFGLISLLFVSPQTPTPAHINTSRLTSCSKLPLSFASSLFALDVDVFPKDESGENLWPIRQVMGLICMSLSRPMPQRRCAGISSTALTTFPSSPFPIQRPPSPPKPPPKRLANTAQSASPPPSSSSSSPPPSSSTRSSPFPATGAKDYSPPSTPQPPPLHQPPPPNLHAQNMTRTPAPTPKPSTTPTVAKESTRQIASSSSPITSSPARPPKGNKTAHPPRDRALLPGLIPLSAARTLKRKEGRNVSQLQDRTLSTHPHHQPCKRARRTG